MVTWISTDNLDTKSTEITNVGTIVTGIYAPINKVATLSAQDSSTLLLSGNICSCSQLQTDACYHIDRLLTYLSVDHSLSE